MRGECVAVCCSVLQCVAVCPHRYTCTIYVWRGVYIYLMCVCLCIRGTVCEGEGEGEGGGERPEQKKCDCYAIQLKCI